MRLAVYPGTFDPITNGHLDLIDRAANLFDRVVVAVATNPAKEPLFTLEERLEMIRRSATEFDNVDVDHFEGLLVDYARGINACAIVRGLRAVSDFEYEFQMALMNRKLSNGIVTVFLMPGDKYTYLNSSIVKEVARFGGDVGCFVPSYVEDKLKEKFSR